MTIDTKSFTEEVLEQASAWIVRLRCDQVSGQDQQDFALWLAENPQHEAAFDEVALLWEAMGKEAPTESQVSALLGKISNSHGPAASNDTLNSSDVNKPPNGGGASTSKPQFPTLAAFAALAASIVIVGLVLLTSPPTTRIDLPTPQALYATPVGKQQRFTLEDGSLLELNTGSRVSVSYSDQKRQLHLLSGEAYFEVVSDPERPFVVTAGAGAVTAIGTAFNIQLAPDGAPSEAMLVAVTEGRVTVNNRTTKASLDLDQGQQVRVSERGEIGNTERADLDLVSAWREKTLIFRQTDLATALNELNRYLATQVDTSDPSLSQLSLTGTFSVAEPEATLEAIIDSFSLQSYTNPFDNKTRLYLR